MTKFENFAQMSNNEMKTINGGNQIAGINLPDVDLDGIDWDKWDWYLGGGTYPW